jgi:uncharacterized membrane protein
MEIAAKHTQTGGPCAMKTPASILRIPVHAVLGILPVGMWTFAQFADFMFFYVGGEQWSIAAFYA